MGLSKNFIVQTIGNSSTRGSTVSPQTLEYASNISYNSFDNQDTTPPISLQRINKQHPNEIYRKPKTTIRNLSIADIELLGQKAELGAKKLTEDYRDYLQNKYGSTVSENTIRSAIKLYRSGKLRTGLRQLREDLPVLDDEFKDYSSREISGLYDDVSIHTVRRELRSYRKRKALEENKTLLSTTTTANVVASTQTPAVSPQTSTLSSEPYAAIKKLYPNSTQEPATWNVSNGYTQTTNQTVIPRSAIHVFKGINLEELYPTNNDLDLAHQQIRERKPKQGKNIFGRIGGDIKKGVIASSLALYLFSNTLGGVNPDANRTAYANTAIERQFQQTQYGVDEIIATVEHSQDSIFPPAELNEQDFHYNSHFGAQVGKVKLADKEYEMLVFSEEENITPEAYGYEGLDKIVKVETEFSRRSASFELQERLLAEGYRFFYFDKGTIAMPHEIYADDIKLTRLMEGLRIYAPTIVGMELDPSQLGERTTVRRDIQLEVYRVDEKGNLYKSTASAKEVLGRFLDRKGRIPRYITTATERVNLETGETLGNISYVGGGPGAISYERERFVNDLIDGTIVIYGEKISDMLILDRKVLPGTLDRFTFKLENGRPSFLDLTRRQVPTIQPTSKPTPSKPEAKATPKPQPTPTILVVDQNGQVTAIPLQTQSPTPTGTSTPFIVTASPTTQLATSTTSATQVIFTATPTFTSSATSSVTPTVFVITPTGTASSTASSTATWTSTITPTGTSTPTLTSTATSTQTIVILTATPTSTSTASATSLPTFTSTSIPTNTSTVIPSPLATFTSTSTSTATSTATPTIIVLTSTPTSTFTVQPTASPLPTFTSSATITPTTTSTGTIPTATWTSTSTSTATSTPTFPAPPSPTAPSTIPTPAPPVPSPTGTPPSPPPQATPTPPVGIFSLSGYFEQISRYLKTMVRTRESSEIGIQYPQNNVHYRTNLWS